MAEILTDEIDFQFYLHETDAKTKVRPASAWVQELIDRLRNPDRTKKVYLPWEKTRLDFQFRPGEVTLWAGQNGHGKSLVTSQFVKAGEVFNIGNITTKRPGTGISPMRWDEVIGRAAPRDFVADELIEL